MPETQYLDEQGNPARHANVYLDDNGNPAPAGHSAPYLTAQNEIIDKIQPQKEGFLSSLASAVGEPIHNVGGIPVPGFLVRAAMGGLDPAQVAEQAKQIYDKVRGMPDEVRKSVSDAMKPGIMNKALPAYNAAKTLAAPMLPSTEGFEQGAAKLGQQIGEHDYTGAIGTGIGTVAPILAPAVVEKGLSIKASPKDVTNAPNDLSRGLGLTSPDPQRSISTYQQVLGHLADIDREAVGAKPARTGKAIFEATQKKVTDLGTPIREAIDKNGTVPAGGNPAQDDAIRSMIKEDVGKPNSVVQLMRPDVMKLEAIGNGNGSLTLQEADTLRQYSRTKASAYHNAEQRGADPAAIQKTMTDWQAAESYLKNVEYNKLRELTGLDIEKLQGDRSALLDVSKTALKAWARDLRQTPGNLAQSIGIPFGASRIINGAIAMNPMSILEGAAEMGSFAGYKGLMSNRRVLQSTMSDLGRSALTAPDYKIP